MLSQAWVLNTLTGVFPEAFEKPWPLSVSCATLSNVAPHAPFLFLKIVLFCQVAVSFLSPGWS